jgi:2-oxoglutarate dehydrogenase E1 component
MTPNIAQQEQLQTNARDLVFDAFRRWGYLGADLDPLGLFEPLEVPELQIGGPDAEDARRYYCGTLAAEFMHMADGERRRWVQEQMENPSRLPMEAQRILELLVRGEVFEQVLQRRYLGTKRYSLEGNVSLLPMLEQILSVAVDHGGQEAVLAMSHRGRLAVMANIAGQVAADIFANFEDVDPRSILGGGDVKYHIGAVGQHELEADKSIRVHLVSNPSHLEAVDPVAAGRARAKQRRRGRGGEAQVVPIILHGDAAFAGQGIWAETLNLADVPGFRVGGSIHIIVNNLIGFTTEPEEAVSSRFASDVAKRLPVPVFHVNADDAEAVVRVAAIATEFRYRFKSDVVIDLIGYRRYGHSEVDDPTITQPQMYRRIKEHPVTYEVYAQKAGIDVAPVVERVRKEFEEEQRRAEAYQKTPNLRRLPEYWKGFIGGPYDPKYEVPTAVEAERLQALAEGLTSYPRGFHIHPKVKKLLEQRMEMGRGQRPMDYGMAEALAFASLVTEGVPVRLSGQDSKRGTFNQRHSALIDTENESEFVPLQHLTSDQARVELYNSPLSEAAVLGFEYGYARDYPEALVLWEAQFGDFANGAQIIIDQFISAGEDKWGLLSGVVLLLPHGYEGQGPEHSSARIERFLQLAAEDNMQVTQPSTAAQYFHLLRRQALRKWRKPLVVFTPKSMLRHPDALSPREELTQGRFYEVLADPKVQNAEHILVCTGKIGHELRRERDARKSQGRWRSRHPDFGLRVVG